MSGEPPRKRQSPSVYRRRRIVLLLSLVVLAGLAWLLIAQPWRGFLRRPRLQPRADIVGDAGCRERPARAGNRDADRRLRVRPPRRKRRRVPRTSATPSGSATPSAKPCVNRDLTVEALTDLDTYEAGQNPQLSIRLTNNGSADCTLNVGTSGQSFTIASGSDVWWRSTDCQTEPSDMVVLLAAGQSVSSAAPLVWDRTRSSVGSCADANRQTAPGGGASYHLSVEIGGIPSTQSKQIFLY